MAGDLGVVCGVSDRGIVREHNADGMAFGSTARPDRPPTVVAVVCDGVGTSALSDKAAQAAADTAAGELLRGAEDGRPAHPTAVLAAAGAVAALSATETPSTTYVAAVVNEVEVSIAWLGDSRAYWIAGDATPGVTVIDGGIVSGSSCLTVDHTARNALLADGSVATHTLTRWIGADARDLWPQVITVRPAQPGTVLLCTDGLWGYLGQPEDLATHVLGSRTPADAVVSLVDAARQRGGRDNITAVAVPFPPAAAGS